MAKPTGNPTGRPRKIPTAKQLEERWEEYKYICDNKKVVKTEFSNRESRFVTEEIPAPVSYTILGFCLYLGLARSGWYEYYESDEKYAAVVAKIHQECEKDVREKFETGTIPTSLAALWMSKFGYSTKTEQDIKGSLPVVIDGSDDLKD